MTICGIILVIYSVIQILTIKQNEIPALDTLLLGLLLLSIELF